MKIKPDKSRLKINTKLGDEFLAIKDMNSSLIIGMLEDNIKIREMPIEKRIKKSSNQNI